MGRGPERSDDTFVLDGVVAALLDLGEGWTLTLLESGQLAIRQDLPSEPNTRTPSPADAYRKLHPDGD